MANDQTPGGGAVRSREVRLGVVMYGGVSLAIYIYGVAREFFEAVRGRGLFKLVKALTDSDVVVDVISGTSAGGINGILLAYCLTNELEFAEAASTWRDEGDIRTLLRNPVHDPDPKSVLRGDGYFLPRLVEEPPGRTFQALGKLARITSCFPDAVEPVGSAKSPPRPAERTNCCRAGPGERADPGRDVFLVDGGVLDNKPFTSTIREIFYRLTERKVDRRLLYVEPDPEVFERLHAVREPNLLRVVWGSLSTIPGYESTVADLKLLAEHNEQVTRFRRLVRHQRSASATALDGPTQEFIDRVCQWVALQLSRRLAARSSFLWTFGVPMSWLALLGGVVDAIENTALLWLLAQPHGQDLGPAVLTACIIGHTCSQAKYVLPAVVVAYCVLGSVWSLFLRSTSGVRRSTSAVGSRC